MAEIRIEEKKGTPILPWIIGLLLLGLIIWGVTEMLDDDDDMMTEEVVVDDDDDDVVAPAPAMNDDYKRPFATYMSYTEDMEGEMGLDHEFSHRALTLLANAAAAVADSKDVEDVTDADSKAARVKRMADEIMKDPMATDHADKIRMSALLVTEILEDVDNRSYGGAAKTDIENLRKEAQAITAETLTLNQKEDVRTFFRQARNVLGRMN